MYKGAGQIMSITVKNLTYIYSKNSPFERVALNNISFDIKDGEFVGLIGHTGSGKSTLIEHLNGLIKPTEGNIFIDGIDITEPKCDLKNIRSKVGLVFQYPEYQLFEETVYKDIAYGPGNLGLTDEEIKERVFSAISLLGLNPELLERSPFELSGGQKRRVAIAGVLAMEPSVLILDEPTAGLDPKSRNLLLKQLKILHKKRKITIILVSHSMEDIADTVEKVMVLSKGEVICFDTVEKIFKKSTLLKSIGLDVPQICDVLDHLIKSGAQIPDNICNVNDAADAIYTLVKGANNA